MAIIGGSSKFCQECRAWTFFLYVEGDGIVAKVCVKCKERRDHPYGADHVLQYLVRPLPSKDCAQENSTGRLLCEVVHTMPK